MEYDDESELTEYIWSYFGHLMFASSSGKGLANLGEPFFQFRNSSRGPGPRDGGDMQLRFLSRDTVLEMLAVMACLAAAFLTIPPIFTTRPSRETVRHWEEDYSSFLPPGYTDFRGHWQSQDVGVRIFSFRCPHGWGGDRSLRYLKSHIAAFKPYEEEHDEVALRCPVDYSDPAGFDEYRFIYQKENDKIFGMFANLDSEMDVHGALVKQLREIAHAEKPR